MSKSQLGQDTKVLSFYNNKRNGYFIEIGASDGINLSNTYLLETQFNWKGICVEPIPIIYKQLVINRPNSLCYDNAIYNSSNMIVEFDIAINDELISGISANLDLYKKTVDKNKCTINVKTLSLNDLLDKSNAPRFIEYLSLDTEGSEYEILKTFNFNKYTFGLIDVEHNYVEPRRTNIRKLLLNNGYIYIGENKWDDMYKHSSL
jgi:FkbM family methyltransferase